MRTVLSKLQYNNPKVLSTLQYINPNRIFNRHNFWSSLFRFTNFTLSNRAESSYAETVKRHPGLGERVNSNPTVIGSGNRTTKPYLRGTTTSDPLTNGAKIAIAGISGAAATNPYFGMIDTYEILCRAATIGDTKIVEACLRSKITLTFDHTQNPIAIAIELGKLDIAKQMYDSPNFPRELINQPLQRPIIFNLFLNGKLDTLIKSLEMFPELDLNWQSPSNRRTILHFAIISNNHEWVEALLKNGADSNIRDAHDNVAADYFTYPNKNMEEILHKYGVKKTKDLTEEMSLENDRLNVIDAIILRRAPEEIMEIFYRKHKHDRNEVETSRLLPIRSAPLMAACRNNNIEACKTILSYGDFEVTRDMLEDAIIYNKKKIFDSLLRYSDVNSKSKFADGATALHLAVLFNRADMVKDLLKCPGINLRIEDDLGRTPLDLAHILGGDREEAIKALEEYKPDLKNFVSALVPNILRNNRTSISK